MATALSVCGSCFWYVSGWLYARNAMSIEYLCDDYGAQVHGVIVSITGLLKIGVDSEMQLAIQQQAFSSLSGFDSSDVSAIGQFVSRLVQTLLGFAVFTGLVYFIGKNLFKGTGTYPEVAYTFALFYVPISVVSAVIGIIPILGALVAFILGLINIYFGYLAVQSSMNLRDSTSAIVTLVLSYIGSAIVIGILTSLIIVPLFLVRAATGN